MIFRTALLIALIGHEVRFSVAGKVGLPVAAGAGLGDTPEEDAGRMTIGYRSVGKARRLQAQYRLIELLANDK